MKKDISTLQDIELMVRKFYDKLLLDPAINHHFLAIPDIDSHQKIICDFWSTLLLGTQIYKNNTIQAHRELALKVEEFSVWTRHFDDTVHELFEGDKAEEAISRANTIALTMRYKLLGK